MAKRRRRSARGDSADYADVEPKIEIDFDAIDCYSTGFEEILLPSTSSSRPRPQQPAAAAAADQSELIVPRANMQRIFAALSKHSEHEQTVAARLCSMATAIQRLTAEVADVKRLLTGGASITSASIDSYAAPTKLDRPPSPTNDDGDFKPPSPVVTPLRNVRTQSFVDRLPLRTYAELTEFEGSHGDRLDDIGNHLLAQIRSSKATTPRQYMMLLLRAVYDDELLAACTWFGLRGDKPPLCGTKLASLVVDLCQHLVPEWRRADVIEKFQYYLRCGTPRRSGTTSEVAARVRTTGSNNRPAGEDDEDSTTRNGFNADETSATTTTRRHRVTDPPPVFSALRSRFRCLAHIPLRSYEAVLEFERTALDDDDLHAYLVTIGGKKPATMAANLMSAVYDADVWCVTTWMGRRGRLPIVDTRIPYVIIDVVNEAFPKLERSEIETMLREFIRHAGFLRRRAEADGSTSKPTNNSNDDSIDSSGGRTPKVGQQRQDNVQQSTASRTIRRTETLAIRKSPQPDRGRMRREQSSPSSNDEGDDDAADDDNYAEDSNSDEDHIENEDDDDEEYTPRPTAARRQLGKKALPPPLRPHQFPAIYNRLPLRTYAELLAFERRIDNVEEMERFLSSLAVGKNKSQRIVRICRVVYDDELLLQMSWQGVRDTDVSQWLKAPFVGTRLPALICNVLLQQMPDLQSDSVLNTIRKYVLRASERRRKAERHIERRQRKEPAVVNETTNEGPNVDVNVQLSVPVFVPLASGEPRWAEHYRSTLPLRTYDAVLAFEDWLEDEDEDDLKLYLQNAVGTDDIDLPTLIDRTADAIYTDELLGRMSWLGERNAGNEWLKQPLRVTKLPYLIVELCQRRFGQRTRDDCLEAFQQFVADATERVDGQDGNAGGS